MNAKVVACAAVIVTAPPALASGFVQTMTCSHDGGPFPCQPGEQPRPVRWDDRCIVFYVNEVGTDDVPGDPGTIHPLVLDAVRRGFATWTDVEQSNLRLQFGGLSNDDRAEFVSDRGEDGNANIVMWRDSGWPYASATAFAITSVTFDPTNGVIADADIELNGEHHQFTVGDAGIVVDVANTVTHEVGHFIGLDHSKVPEATMFGSAPEGETQKRTLHSDDIQGLVHIYPDDGTTPSCGDFPDYFEAPGEGNGEDGCCTDASSTVSSRPSALLALLVAVAFGWQRRRKT